ncbi:hypothetical protein TNCV_2375851 [Trichonephila clavipes]|nr:hypothetical protein TNCV_2375851 [Trichonephila clavipes]
MPFHHPLCGHGSPVVKVTDSWLVCHEFEPEQLKTRRVEKLMHVKSVGTQRSSRCWDVEYPRMKRTTTGLRCIKLSPTYPNLHLWDFNHQIRTLRTTVQFTELATNAALMFLAATAAL